MPIQRFAILDVETTCGDPTLGRVMEVAVLAFDDRVERLRWDSLLDPRAPIPPFIRKLTGITTKMTDGTPTFPMVVRTLETLTEDRIVVAHNVRYDMTTLEHEFARTGLVFERRTLCTESVSRRVLPQLSHHNLGSLCRYFGIPFIAKHRAAADAEATAQLLFRLIDAVGMEKVLEHATTWSHALRA
jgi:DNA polymerase III subunit epsilon